MDQIPDLSSNPKNVKIGKIKRSLSLSQEIEQNRGLAEGDPKISQNFSLTQRQAKDDSHNKQLNIGRTDLNELPTPENYENSLAYHLRNNHKQNFLTF